MDRSKHCLLSLSSCRSTDFFFFYFVFHDRPPINPFFVSLFLCLTAKTLHIGELDVSPLPMLGTKYWVLTGFLSVTKWAVSRFLCRPLHDWDWNMCRITLERGSRQPRQAMITFSHFWFPSAVGLSTACPPCSELRTSLNKKQNRNQNIF